jgi:hypothetical protein
LFQLTKTGLNGEGDARQAASQEAENPGTTAGAEPSGGGAEKQAEQNPGTTTGGAAAEPSVGGAEKQADHDEHISSEEEEEGMVMIKKEQKIETTAAAAPATADQESEHIELINKVRLAFYNNKKLPSKQNKIGLFSWIMDIFPDASTALMVFPEIACTEHLDPEGCV